MEKYGIGKRSLALFLSLVMLTTVLTPISVYAAKGDLANVDTGLTGNIDTSDTISFPIRILDYEADGMLFEYAEAYSSKTGILAEKTARDFGATWYEDYTIRTSKGGSVNTGNYWSNVTLALNTGTYANYTRMTWAGNTKANWTGNRAGVVMADFSESSTYTTDQIRYMVVVFRSNVRDGSFTVGLNRANLNGAGTSGNYTGNIAVTTENNTNWTYAVLDLQTGTLGSNWSKGAVYGVYVGLPIDASGEWMDLAHVAFFANKDQATAFGEYALTDGSDRGDNRGFGLLRGSRNQGSSGSSANGYGSAFPGLFAYNNTSADYGNAADTVFIIPWDVTNTLDLSSVENLGYQLLGTYGTENIATIGLLESQLSSNGYPIYKEEIVTYLAYLLKHSLEISERTDEGWKNYRYIKGTASDVYGGTDLATALRNAIDDKTITNGDCDAAYGKNLIGTWSDVSSNISTYHDAAYFLLNSIFVPGSYNVPQDDYNYLILSGATNTDGDEVYVFDGGFSTSADPESAGMAIDYNSEKKTIQNTTASGKAHFVYDDSGNTEKTTTLNPFLPITDRNNADGMTKTPYYQDDGVINGVKGQTTKDTLYERNFNFVMTSHGEFVYHADDELFFNFEGDDDVYLFINGELVMDIGSAHSIDSVSFNINDYVNAAKAGTLGSDERNAALALEEGNTYTFAFFYMERHSYGSNIRIETNIHVTDPAMETVKTAWQDGVQLDFGSVVDKDRVVEYGFSILNNGEENLYNLTFTDNDIGVVLDYTNGLKVTGDRVYDANGGTLEASDLTAVITHPDYDDITVTFADNAALKRFLYDLTASGTEEGAGLYIGATVLIRGIGYKLSEAQIKSGSFDNTVFTTSTNKTESKTLHGKAIMRVFVPADPMYYQWAGHELNVTKTKLINDVLAAANQKDNVLAGKVSNLTTDNVNKIELVTKAGNAISSSYVSISSKYDITINYSGIGSHVFYVKVTYNSSKNTVIVPVLVNVTDVTDSVYVLDYGLSVDLTANNELFKNDAVTIPGRDTEHGVIAVGSGASYSPNEISFTASNSNIVIGTYGDFEYEDGAITYTLKKFLEGYDVVQIAVNVYEKDITPSVITGTLDINNEVEMYKNITVLPANVLYYEDNFPAITYTTGTTNTFTSFKQSNDQSEQYGHDGTYEGDTSDDSSTDSLHTIEISEDSDTVVASFEFTGTGFELIGRTNAADSATLVVRVKSGNTDIKVIPVITQFDNYNDGGSEGIYQVPVIRVKDLEHGTYTVEISGVPAYTYDESGAKTGTKTTYLYIDGLRIYQPIGATNEYYLGTENGAQFIELRNEIAAGKIAVAKYTGTIEVSTATSTWTENLHGNLVFNEVNSVDDYILQGPNNEVYMTGTYGKSALVFYVKESGTGAHSLQLALRGLDENLFFSGIDNAPAADVLFGVYKNGEYAWDVLKSDVVSSTEQYYVIDYTKCFYDSSKGAYQIVVIADDGLISFSSLKLTGLELVNIGGETSSISYINGTLYSGDQAVDAASFVNFSSVAEQLRSNVMLSDLEIPQIVTPDPVLPDVAEPGTNNPVQSNTASTVTDAPQYSIPTSNVQGKTHTDIFVYIESYFKKLRELLRKLGITADEEEVTA